MNAADLWARLSAEKLVEGERPEGHKPASPWYVRTMLGIAGWIAAVFLLMFVGAAFAFIMQEAVYAVLARRGLLRRRLTLCSGAFDGNDFAEQFALVVSLVGQVLIVIGIADVLKMQDPRALSRHRRGRGCARAPHSQFPPPRARERGAAVAMRFGDQPAVAARAGGALALRGARLGLARSEEMGWSWRLVASDRLRAGPRASAGRDVPAVRSGMAARRGHRKEELDRAARAVGRSRADRGGPRLGRGRPCPRRRL